MAKVAIKNTRQTVNLSHGLDNCHGFWSDCEVWTIELPYLFTLMFFEII